MPKAAKQHRTTSKPTVSHDDLRGTRTERGYDNRWLRFRKWYLAGNPLCVDCDERGKATAATEVHHIKKMRHHPELKYDNDNLLSLCKSCHTIRTNRGE